jgi:hypothetical protein
MDLSVFHYSALNCRDFLGILENSENSGIPQKSGTEDRIEIHQKSDSQGFRGIGFFFGTFCAGWMWALTNNDINFVEQREMSDG